MHLCNPFMLHQTVKTSVSQLSHLSLARDFFFLGGGFSTFMSFLNILFLSEGAGAVYICRAMLCSTVKQGLQEESLADALALT